MNRHHHCLYLAYRKKYANKARLSLSSLSKKYANKASDSEKDNPKPKIANTTKLHS